MARHGRVAGSASRIHGKVRMNSPTARERRLSFVAFAYAFPLLFGTGCIAFNVGKPETFTHTDRIVETSPAPLRSTVVSAEGRLQQRGSAAVVGLGLAVQDEFEKREHMEMVVVRKRKKLAVGLFPGAAEFLFVPDGALQPVFESGWAAKDGDPVYGLYGSDPRSNMGKYVGAELVFPFSCGLLNGITTINSLLYAPSDEWSCGGHEFIDPAHVQTTSYEGTTVYDASGSPKLRALLRFSEAERNRIGLNTCFYQIDNSSDHGTAGHPFITHTGLIGFHKYLTVFVDGPDKGPSTVVGTETRRHGESATGPFIVDFSIPALGHADWKRVSARETQASFPLPAVERNCTVEAIVSFRPDTSVNGRTASDLTQQALSKAADREWSFDLALKGTGRLPSQPPPPPKKLFEVTNIEPLGEGRYFVRVKVLDQSETWNVIHRITPEVHRLVHKDFRSKNPDVPEQFVRESMRYKTEQDGKFLTFTGWVFSVRPVEDGWFYDHDTQRGWVRLRVMGGIPADEARKWAHENIAEIVKYKNVALEVGKAPPPGAIYCSLDESFEDGVLTVEFEAVQ